MQLRNPVPKISLLILVAAPLYLLLISGQDRMSDGGLSGDEMYLAEMIFSLLPALSIGATLGLGLLRAYKARRWGWFWIQVFVFPLAYIYTLFLDRGEGPNNSFKPRPLRGSA